jgi:hypothetical protein
MTAFRRSTVDLLLPLLLPDDLDLSLTTVPRYTSSSCGSITGSARTGTCASRAAGSRRSNPSAELAHAVAGTQDDVARAFLHDEPGSGSSRSIRTPDGGVAWHLADCGALTCERAAGIGSRDAWFIERC